MKNTDIFHIFVQNIDCGYSLEPPQRGSSNEYPRSMFLSRNKKNNVYPCKPQFYYIKVGFKGSELYRYVFVILFYNINPSVALILINCTGVDPGLFNRGWGDPKFPRVFELIQLLLVLEQKGLSQQY